MTKKQKALAISTYLEELYPETPIPLDHKDAYTLLVAVLLSAQCTDVRVNKVTPQLFATFPTALDLAQAEPEGNRVVRNLKTATEILTTSAGAAQAAGKAGIALIKLAPLAAALYQIATHLFGGCG